MTELTIVDISWSERFKLSYSTEEQIYEIPDGKLLSGQGLYCIYGRHPVYGPDVLLYIGETKQSESRKRSFSERLSEHLKGRFWYHANLSVSLGTADCEQPLSHTAIRQIESILIAAHKPALNRRHIDCAMAGAERYLVRNWGFLNVLQHECSGYYWRQDC